jgi:hypothetical protein
MPNMHFLQFYLKRTLYPQNHSAKRRIKIFSNYLSEFSQIRANDCERQLIGPT